MSDEKIYSPYRSPAELTCLSFLVNHKHADPPVLNSFLISSNRRTGIDETKKGLKKALFETVFTTRSSS